MPLASTKDILLDASEKGYAVGAYNVNDMEILQGVIRGCEETKAPVIVAVTEGAIKYAGLEYLVAMVKVAVDEVDFPVALHLDHGRDLAVIRRCIEAGFSSVMVDASHLPYEDNVRITKEVVQMAHPAGVAVEAELGRLLGVEDGVSVREREATLTDPEEAERFVEATGVDFLAPAIGTSHGAFKFKGRPKLDMGRLREIRERVGVPLVLHGASSVPRWLVDLLNTYGGNLKDTGGVPPEQLKEAIASGVAKVNTDTDLRLAFTAAVRKVLQEAPEVFDPRKILGPARDLIARVVAEKNRLFGSAGRAA